MKDLLSYIIRGILGEEKFTVTEMEDGGRVNLTVDLKPEVTGLLIGKKGKTIKAIRNLVRVKATLEKKAFNIIVGEPS